MKEKIDKIVQEGDWEFAKLLKLDQICEDLANKMYTELSPSEILELVWEISEDGARSIGQIVSYHAKSQLKNEFKTSFQKCFESATVKFKSPAQEMKVEKSISAEKPPLPKQKAKKSDKEKEMIKGEDGFDMPKGVKRV